MIMSSKNNSVCLLLTVFSDAATHLIFLIENSSLKPFSVVSAFVIIMHTILMELREKIGWLVHGSTWHILRVFSGR